MSLILNIDTATTTASVSLALDGKLLQKQTNANQKDHATWLHTAIEELLKTSGYLITDLNAVAVVAGPGSYTGLRVGMASAKGFCFALNIPFIILNTLELMAFVAAKTVSTEILLCPMMDARRMEIFTALYNSELEVLIAPCAMVLEQGAFEEWLQNASILFFGSGSTKAKTLITHTNARFRDISYEPEDITNISRRYFLASQFSDLAYSAPIYLKDFYTHQKK